MLDLKQEDVAKKLKTSRSNWNKYENGTQTLNADLIEKLREIYNLSVHWLFTGQGPMLIDIENSGIGLDEALEFLDTNKLFDEQEKNFKLRLEYYEKHPEELEKINKIIKLHDEFNEKVNEILNKKPKK